MSSLSDLRALVTSVTQPGDRHRASITELGEFLRENKFSLLLSQSALRSHYEQGSVDLKDLIKDIVSVPDRTINVIGTNVKELPDWIFPSRFCDEILRNFSLSLRYI